MLYLGKEMEGIMNAHFSRALLVLSLTTFICLLYPEYVMLDDVYEYIGEDDEIEQTDKNDLHSWEKIMSVQASEVEISSKWFSSIGNKSDKNSLRTEQEDNTLWKMIKEMQQ